MRDHRWELVDREGATCYPGGETGACVDDSRMITLPDRGRSGRPHCADRCTRDRSRSPGAMRQGRQRGDGSWDGPGGYASDRGGHPAPTPTGAGPAHRHPRPARRPRPRARLRAEMGRVPRGRAPGTDLVAAPPGAHPVLPRPLPRPRRSPARRAGPRRRGGVLGPRGQPTRLRGASPRAGRWPAGRPSTRRSLWPSTSWPTTTPTCVRSRWPTGAGTSPRRRWVSARRGRCARRLSTSPRPRSG